MLAAVGLSGVVRLDVAGEVVRVVGEERAHRAAVHFALFRRFST